MEMIHYYVERKKLAKLGIIVNADEIPAIWCDAFLTIERALDDLNAEADKKNKARKKKG